MKKFQIIIWMALIHFAFTGCVETIDFSTDWNGGQLVVDGRISAGSGPFFLSLRQTAPIEQKSLPVSGAKIILEEQAGPQYFYAEQEEGEYVLENKPGSIVDLKEGKAYSVKIELTDGRRYASHQEIIPLGWAKMDSVYFDFEELEVLNSIGNVIKYWVVNVYIDAHLLSGAGPRPTLRWDVEEVYKLSETDYPDPFGYIPPSCYVYVYPGSEGFQMLDTKELESTKIQGIKVATQRLDNRFDEKHYFNVYQTTLTEKAYTYWSQLRQTIFEVGTIFDTPPAPVEGNLFNIDNPEEQVLGYFETVNVDTLRRFILPSDIPVRLIPRCKFDIYFYRTYPPVCSDCISEPNSTYLRPDYF